jgi:DNA-binding transcriptional LysR family regulator
MASRQRRTPRQFDIPQRARQWFERMDFVTLAQTQMVADYANVSRVARVLGVRQSVVSRRIRALEDELGVSLFERRQNGVRLTVAGRRFVERTRAALTEIESAARNAMAAGRGTEGLVRIGLFHGPMPAFLTELVKDFRDEHPHVRLEFAAGEARDHFSKIMERSLDIAVVAGTDHSPDCDAQLLWKSRVVVVLPHDHMLAIGEAVDWMYLRDERFIFGLDSSSECFRELVARRSGGDGRLTEIEHFPVVRETLFQLVALGFGVSLTSEASQSMDCSGVAIRALAGEEDWIGYSAIWLAENDNPALRRFLGLARAKAAAWQKTPLMTNSTAGQR